MKIHDLARHLNVSISTVSRAFNDASDVSEATRKRVLEAARQLGYAPNQSGRSLRQGTTGMIGFMLIADRARALKGEAFFMTLFDGLQAVLVQHNLDLVIHYCGADQDPEHYVRRIIERRLVDGLIISQTTRIDRRIDYLIKQDLPFIAFGRSQSGGEHSWVDLDFEGAAEASINHLVKLGHRRIAVATTADDINFGSLYLTACRAALERRGLSLDEAHILREAMSEAGGYRVGERLTALADPPTAIVVVENSMVIGLYGCLRRAGIVPGRDLSIVGFDESPANGVLLQPSLTQFRLSLVDLGAWFGEHMLALIRGQQPGAPVPFARKLWPMEMVVGASTGPVPATRRDAKGGLT